MSQINEYEFFFFFFCTHLSVQLSFRYKKCNSIAKKLVHSELVILIYRYLRDQDLSGCSYLQEASFSNTLSSLNIVPYQKGGRSIWTKILYLHLHKLDNHLAVTVSLTGLKHSSSISAGSSLVHKPISSNQ